LVAIAAAVVLAALALSPAGAKVGDWIGDVVDPAPEATMGSLASLPAPGRLLAVADGGAWIVRDGGRRQLGSFTDATWSPGGLHVAGARGRRLVAVDPEGVEHWTLVADGPVTVPRWSPDGYRIAYRSGSELWVTTGDNENRWRLARESAPTPPAWKPLAAPAPQVLAFVAGERVRIVEVDTGRVLGQTPPGPVPRDIWWGEDGRLVTVTARSVRIHGPSGRLLRTISVPSTASVIAPRGKRLALISRLGGASSLDLLDLDGSVRSLFSTRGELAGLTWSIDGSVIVVGLPAADEWLFVRLRGGFEGVRHVRRLLRGGHEPRSGAFPRPAGWCWAEPVNRTATGRPPCSPGSRP
jgi:Tol biopolymer transport system component